jgi:hypothetical protein
MSLFLFSVADRKHTHMRAFSLRSHINSVNLRFHFIGIVCTYKQEVIFCNRSDKRCDNLTAGVVYVACLDLQLYEIMKVTSYTWEISKTKIRKVSLVLAIRHPLSRSRVSVYRCATEFLLKSFCLLRTSRAISMNAGCLL